MLLLNTRKNFLTFGEDDADDGNTPQKIPLLLLWTNYHKRCAVIQYTLITVHTVLPVWGLRSVSLGLNQDVLRSVFILEASGKTPFPCLFPVSRVHCGSGPPWASWHHSDLCFHLQISSRDSDPLSSLFKDLTIPWVPLDKPGRSPLLKILPLIPPAKSHWPCQVTYL